MGMSVFPTLIHEFDFSNFTEVESDIIKSVYKEQKDDSIGITISNMGGWHSKDLPTNHFISNIILTELGKYFSENNIFKEGTALSLQNVWIIINNKGHYNTMHTHPGSDLSGVCWIKTPQDCGRLEFENPNSHSRHNEINCYTDNFKQGTGIYQSWWYEPQVGRIVIFPASLYHQVKPNNSNQDRISISFNINLTEKN